MKISGVEVLFTPESPQKEGTFLWKNSLGVEIVRVVLKPSHSKYGMSWDSYYSAVTHGGRNVTQLSGGFAEVEIDT